jgi:hypothetical protein
LKTTIDLKFNIDIENCNINHLTGVLQQISPQINSSIITQVLEQFADFYMVAEELPFSCSCGCKQATWKTKKAKTTEILFGLLPLLLTQMQVKCKNCKKRYFITRKLLELAPRAKLSEKAKEAIALIGSFCSYRVSSTVMALSGGYTISKNMVWQCVQQVGEKMTFGVDLDGSQEFQADGTGIPINGIKKRGKELKVLIQKKIRGGVHIVNVTLGKYHSEWDKLFSPIIEDLKLMKNPILTTDGDVAILKGIKELKIIVQRCLWHIPHQAKYTMWQDEITRKSEDWLKIMGKLYNIVAISYTGEDEDVIAKIIDEKNKLMDKLIKFCLNKKYMKTYKYLLNAKPDMFNALENKYYCKSQSLVERVMKTVNARIDVGKWGTPGALNVLKVRLAYYYNDFNVSFKNEMKTSLNFKKGG